MFFNSALLSTFYLVPLVLAFQPINRLKQGTSTNSEYSTNWSGALWAKPKGTFTKITGTFTVPNPTGGVGDSAAAWVGIDGDTCQTAILQTGLTFTVEAGSPSYSAWYEWYPAAAIYFNGNDITFHAGNVVTLTVEATSPTSGTATVENTSTGQKVSAEVSSSSALCQQDAEWIVEDYNSGPSLSDQTPVPFADFGTITFSNAVASGAGGKTYTPSGATTIIMEQNGQELTSVSTSGSSVTITYV